MKDILESTLPNEINKRLEINHGFGWSESLTVDTLSDFFQAMVKFLSVRKSKDIPVVLELRDINGGFHFAAYVAFLNQQESNSDVGSWSLNFTFDANDIESDWKKYDFIQDTEATMIFYDTTYTNSGITWRFEANTEDDVTNEGSVAQIIPVLIDALADYMRMNVNTNPELDISGLISFRAENLNNGVYIGVTPSPTLKQLIKNDSEIAYNG